MCWFVFVLVVDSGLSTPINCVYDLRLLGLLIG